MTDEFYFITLNVSSHLWLGYGSLIVINYFPMRPPERGFMADQGVKYSVQIKHCYNQFSPCNAQYKYYLVMTARVRGMQLCGML